MELQKIEDLGVSRSGKTSWFEYQDFICNLHNESRNKNIQLKNVLYENLELIKENTIFVWEGWINGNYFQPNLIEVAEEAEKEFIKRELLENGGICQYNLPNGKKISLIKIPEGPSAIKQLTKVILTNWYSHRGNYSQEEIDKRIEEKLSKENFIRTQIGHELQEQRLDALPLADAIFVLDACQRKDISQLEKLFSPCPGNFDFSYI